MSRVVSTMFVLLTIVAIVACNEGPPPTLTEEQETLAIQSIRGYTEVLDAAVGQDGRTLSLAVVVAVATSKERAKELGDNFVRLVKSFGPDEAPGTDIGDGDFDYLIAVAYPDETIIARGAKSRGSSRISW
jgi:hypothetical protein